MSIFSKYTLEIELTNEELLLLEQEMNARNERHKKATGKDGTWTIEQELRNIIMGHVRDKVIEERIRKSKPC